MILIQKRKHGNWVLFPFVKIKLRLNPKLTGKHKSATIKLFKDEDSDRKILQKLHCLLYMEWSYSMVALYYQYMQFLNVTQNNQKMELLLMIHIKLVILSIQLLNNCINHLLSRASSTKIFGTMNTIFDHTHHSLIQSISKRRELQMPEKHRRWQQQCYRVCSLLYNQLLVSNITTWSTLLKNGMFCTYIACQFTQFSYIKMRYS